MTNETENENSLNNGNLNELLDIKVDELDETALREKLTEIIPKYKETHQSNKQLFERAKTAEGGLKELREKLKSIEPIPKEPEKVAPQAKTGELDETQLDYLDLKGISDSEEIDVIKRVMDRTGLTVRQALKDDYVQAQLKTIKDKKAVQDATPSGTRRSGVPVEGFEAALAKFQATGELPKDFDLKSKVIDAVVPKEVSSTPPWRR